METLRRKRIALVHDWLNGMRGGEKCLEVLCEMFPDATLFTLIHQEGRLSKTIEKMEVSQLRTGGLIFAIIGFIIIYFIKN